MPTDDEARTQGWQGVDQGTLDSLGAELRALPEVRVAYLFGSRARGRARRDSDYDIAVLVDEAAVADSGASYRELWRLLRNIGREIPSGLFDLVILNGTSPLLRYHVLRDGILLHARSPVERIRFATSTIRDYQDDEVRRRERYRVRVDRIRRWLAHGRA